MIGKDVMKNKLKEIKAKKSFYNFITNFLHLKSTKHCLKYL